MGKLLIALGDSYTEGVGCYEPELLENFLKTGKSVNWFEEEWTKVYKASVRRFKQYGWPSLVGKQLGYKALNLAEGGSSNSMMAKKLLTSEYENLLDRYEKVMVIFLLTVPHRLSFFRWGRPESMMTQDNNNITKDKLMEAWLEFLDFSEKDAWLENIFYLRAVESFCKANNYEFFYGVAWGTDIEVVNQYYNSSRNLHNYRDAQDIDIINFDYYLPKGSDKRAVCDHPNEKGYEKIADVICNIIRKNFEDVI